MMRIIFVFCICIYWSGISFGQSNDTIYLEKNLKYIRLIKGKGPHIKPGQKVKITYTGYLAADNTIFDSNTGKKGFWFTTGKDEVIEGWEMIIKKMKAGEKIRLFVPATLGYGNEGMEDPENTGEYIIPPEADLVFDIEITGVK